MVANHLASWVTVAFAVLLVLLAVSDQGPGAVGASVLLLLWAVAMLAVFFGVHHAVHRGERRSGRQGPMR